jgi:two-component system cell cycle sensor histidine kinase/response regulator CckA
MKNEDPSKIQSDEDIAFLRNQLSVSKAEEKRRSEVERELRTRLQQQATITELSELALNYGGLDKLMEAAMTALAERLDVEFVKLLELMPDGNSLLLKHGVGWKPGFVGSTYVDAAENSQAGYTLLSRKPVIVTELDRETRFKGPSLLTSHNVVSGMSVIIRGSNGPYGILAVHTTKLRLFTEHDIQFLQSVANVLAQAIARTRTMDDFRLQGQIVDQIHDAVVSTNLDGIVTSWNMGAENLFGYSRQEAIGQHISFVYTEDQHKFLQTHIIEPLLKKGSHKVEVRMLRKSGRTFFAHLSLSVLRNAEGEVVGMIGYSMDITERKLMVTQIHELGRSIGSLSSAIHALKSGAWQQANLRGELLLGMEYEANHLKRFLNDLVILDERASGTLSIKRRAISPSEWLTQAIAPWKEVAIQKGLVWKVTIPNDLPVTQLDPDRIDQILGNLISNAIKFTSAGGEVKIQSGIRGEELWIRVKDSGVGISPDEQEILFVPFYRSDLSKVESKGMGLGLTIVYDLVKAHDGRVELKSAPEDGSSFTVWLPIET